MLPSSLTVSVDRDDGRTLPVQIADGIRTAIDSGRLDSDTRLPSSRALSEEVGVSRSIVESAYDQLTAEGWLVAKRGSGTFVRRLPSPTSASRATPAVAAAGPPQPRLRLATGTPWLPTAPSAAWKRAWRAVGSAGLPQEYPDPRGEPELRAGIARLLGRARGLHTDASRVVVTTGSIHGMSLALSALTPEDAITPPVLAHENPGYRAATTTARRGGWQIFDVPVDDHGLVTDALTGTPAATRAIYVTPSHQYPTGSLLPVGRRRALAEHARTYDLMIIEDDYDSEFRYDVAPLPTMAELAPDRTIYLGTVAKTLGGGVRIGWIVAPPTVVDRIAAARIELGDYPSIPLQHAVVSLLNDGEWDRTVRAARRVYRERDRYVTGALAKFGRLQGVGAGMHTTLLLDADLADAVAARAAAHGVDVDTLAKSTRTPSPVAGLIVGYGSVSDDDLYRGLGVIVEALETLS